MLHEEIKDFFQGKTNTIISPVAKQGKFWYFLFWESLQYKAG